MNPQQQSLQALENTSSPSLAQGAPAKLSWFWIPYDVISVVCNIEEGVVRTLTEEEVVKKFNSVFIRYKFISGDIKGSSQEIKLKLRERNVYAVLFETSTFLEFKASIARCLKVARLKFLPPFIKNEFEDLVVKKLDALFNKSGLHDLRENLFPHLSLKVKIDPIIFIFKELGIDITNYHIQDFDNFCKVRFYDQQNLVQFLNDLKHLKLNNLKLMSDEDQDFKPITLLNCEIPDSTFKLRKDTYLYVSKREINKKFINNYLQAICLNRISETFVHQEMFEGVFNFNYLPTGKILISRATSQLNVLTFQRFITQIDSYLEPYIKQDSYIDKIIEHYGSRATSNFHNYLSVLPNYSIYESKIVDNEIDMHTSFRWHPHFRLCRATYTQLKDQCLGLKVNTNIESLFHSWWKQVSEMLSYLHDLTRRDKLHPYRIEALHFCAHYCNESFLLRVDFTSEKFHKKIISVEDDNLINKLISVNQSVRHKPYIEQVQQILKPLQKEEIKVLIIHPAQKFKFEFVEEGILCLYSTPDVNKVEIRCENFIEHINMLVFKIALLTNTECQKNILSEFPFKIRAHIIKKLSNIKDGIELQEINKVFLRVIDKIGANLRQQFTKLEEELNLKQLEVADENYKEVLIEANKKLLLVSAKLSQLTSKFTPKTFLDYVIYINSTLKEELENLTTLIDLSCNIQRAFDIKFNDKIIKSIKAHQIDENKINHLAQKILALIYQLNKNKEKIKSRLNVLLPKINDTQLMANTSELKELTKMRVHLEKIDSEINKLNIPTLSLVSGQDYKKIELEKGKDKAPAESKNLNIKIAQLKESYNLLKKEVNNIVSERSNVKQEVLQAQTNLESVKAEFKKATNVIEEAQQASKNLIQQQNEMTLKQSALKDYKIKINQKVKDAKLKLKSLKKQYNKLDDDLKKKEEELNNLKLTCQSQETKLQEAIIKHNNLKNKQLSEISLLLEEEKKCQLNISNLESKIKSKERDLKLLTTHYRSLKHNYNSFKSYEEALQLHTANVVKFDAQKAELNNKKKVLASEKVKLKEKDRMLATQEAKLNEKDKMFATQEAELKKKQEMLHSQEAELYQKQVMLNTQEAQLKLQEERPATKEAKLNQKNKMLQNNRLGQLCLFGSMILLGLTSNSSQYFKLSIIGSKVLACSALYYHFPTNTKSSKIEYFTPLPAILLLVLNLYQGCKELKFNY